MQESDLIGRTISHYQILSEISRGGMGIVYRALDTKLNRHVAFKVLPAELVGEGDRKERFVQEAQAAAALHHANIATIFETDESDGVTFITMELIEGSKLRDLLQSNPVPLPRALDLSAEIAEGLALAHGKGIVHRDLKSANIMVTGDGHAKIIDFGLAKLLPFGDGGSEMPTAFGQKTDPGVVMGTLSYMSPEQARGQSVDHRSDIFSFGVVLYEMLSGVSPFDKTSGADTLSAILNEPAPPLSIQGPALSADAASDVHRILDKCLAKDPGERYQSTQDLLVDLRAAKRRLESGAPASMPPSEPSVTFPSTSPAYRKPWWLAGAAVTTGLVIAGWWMTRPSDDVVPDTGTATVATGTEPSVAVLYFENASGDASLDWLRTGLTDMLVTDLSQSRNIKVLSTERLYQILEELNRTDDRVVSLDVVQEVAARAGVGTVILGSVMKAGENIRINLRVQEAASGDILTSERVEGVGESSIFDMVDDLTRRIKGNFDVPEAADASDGLIKDVTTSSIEAYRYYAEGAQLHMGMNEEAALPLLQKAVEADPKFALALTRLATVHGNLGHRAESLEFARLAFDNSERLPDRERYYVQGMHYWRSLDTWHLAQGAFEKMVEVNPEAAARHNLAMLLLGGGETDRAIEHFEELRRRESSFPPSYQQLADAYGERGEIAMGEAVVKDFVEKHPDSVAGQINLGDYLAQIGRLDDALSAYDNAEALRPGAYRVRTGRFRVRLLREQWDDAEAAADEFVASRDPARQSEALRGKAEIMLYRGRSRESLELLESAIVVDPNRSQTHSQKAEVHLSLGELDAVRDAYERRRTDGSAFGEFGANELEALTQARRGARIQAEETLDANRVLMASWSLDSPSFTRRQQYIEGRVALDLGDPELAVEKLGQAASTLPVRGFRSFRRHVPIWFGLGGAHLALGEHEEARAWFQRIVDSTTERVPYPVEYVRSFYFLGQIHEALVDAEQARANYQRFVDHWGDGDMDRDRVEEARTKL